MDTLLGLSVSMSVVLPLIGLLTLTPLSKTLIRISAFVMTAGKISIRDDVELEYALSA